MCSFVLSLCNLIIPVPVQYMATGPVQTAWRWSYQLCQPCWPPAENKVQQFCEIYFNTTNRIQFNFTFILLMHADIYNRRDYSFVFKFLFLWKTVHRIQYEIFILEVHIKT